jgi:hypothetical protein
MSDDRPPIPTTESPTPTPPPPRAPPIGRAQSTNDLPYTVHVWRLDITSPGLFIPDHRCFGIDKNPRREAWEFYKTVRADWKWIETPWGIVHGTGSYAMFLREWAFQVDALSRRLLDRHGWGDARRRLTALVPSNPIRPEYREVMGASDKPRPPPRDMAPDTGQAVDDWGVPR